MKTKEQYIKEYLESATKMNIDLELPEQAIIKTAEMAWAVDCSAVKPTDVPANEPRKKGE